MRFRTPILAATSACALLAACSDSTDDLSPVANSGKYGDLSGKPDLETFARAADLHEVAMTGAYADLDGTPDLQIYAQTDHLSPVALSGSYGDLLDTPDLSPFVMAEALAPLAYSGSYADLEDAPDLSVYAPITSLSAVASSGSYADLAGVPWDANDVRISTSAGVTIDGVTADPLLIHTAEHGPAQVDQASDQDDTLLDAATSHWQSFTPGVAGLLVGIDVERWYDSPASGYTLNVYEGEGTGGRLIHTESNRSLTSDFGTVQLSSPIRLEASVQYTWELVHAEPFELVGYLWATYAGGRGSAMPDYAGMDFRFATRMRPALETKQASLTVTAAGAVGVGTAAPTAALDVAGDLRVRATSSPAANDPCEAGQLAWDTGFVYVCVQQNTWKRASLVAY